MKFVQDLDKKDSWKEMDGEGDLEKKLNHYLTRQFIFTKDVPFDECLSEAKDILEMTGSDENLQKQICSYLLQSFSIYRDKDRDFDRYMPSAADILKILRNK